MLSRNTTVISSFNGITAALRDTPLCFSLWVISEIIGIRNVRAASLMNSQGVIVKPTPDALVAAADDLGDEFVNEHNIALGLFITFPLE